MWSVAPTGRNTFVSAKVSKTISACVRPFQLCSEQSLQGSSASTPNKMAQELAPLVWSLLLIFEKLLGVGVEGHRFASASFWTDGLRLLPSTPSTSMKNLAAGLLTADLTTSLRWCGPPHW